MNPTADDIWRAIVAAAEVTGADPKHVFSGQFSGIYAGKVGKARAAVFFCLAGFRDLEAEAWAVRFGWNQNERAALAVVGRHRNNGILHGRETHAAAEALGIDPNAPYEHDNALWNAKKSAAAERRKAAREARDQKSKDRITAAQKRCEETAKAARKELAKSPAAQPVAKTPRIVGTRSANRTKPEPPAPKPIAPPTSEAEAIDRLFRSIPEKRSF
jgi:hypothetical protein